ncbi:MULTISPECIES: glycine amidinotransferase [unclassified Amycolatopsis]|uniref:glycine amidinotransferase n=1 Tax=unclassified Amycolatopsis TaxID=2618356 RepID=UPI002E15D06B|nr:MULTISPECIES: glycine amidinotransferase [unclassified Amycolatopsis]WSJ80358.1 glycine amidinotransferase [Amycolatopsis sp. NBC_01307]WSK76161.1 glycine amidinotransferase [Amycolatopsis sp. NBC_01286]
MKLNSFDEWSPLKEVVLGSAQNYTMHERDLSFDMFFYDQLADQKSFYDHMYYPRLTPLSGQAESEAPPRFPIKRQYVEELNEDVEGMADLLTGLGVTVHRPLAVDDNIEVRTPAWTASVVPPLNVRDNTLVLGDEIIETPPMLRSRYFETQFLKPIFHKYFNEGARWTVMPRPLMTDSSFDPSYVKGGLVELVRDPQPGPLDVGFEMMFDAAQCVRLGKHILVNMTTANHRMAGDWLRRHLADRFTILPVYALADSHIDSMILPLRPGLLLVRTPAIFNALPDELQKWDVIYAPEPQENNFPTYDDDDLVLTTKYIDLNVLSVGPDTVLANEANPELVRTLERHGFTVGTFRHRHRRLFGGGLHCFTLDTVREGSEAADYLS